MNKVNTVSIAVAVGLHVCLGCFLLLSFDSHKTLKISQQVPKVQPKIIEAKAVTQEALKKEVARIESIEKKKQQQARAKAQKLANEKKALERAKKKEAQRLANIKKELEKTRALQKKEEQKRKLALKKEQEDLKKLKQEQEELRAEKKRAEQERAKAIEIAKAEKEAEKLRQEKIAIAKALEEKKLREALAQKRNREQVMSEIRQHVQLIQSKIHQNWRQPLGIELSGKTCKISVNLLSSGVVISAAVVESSGDKAIDRSAELAVMKSSPLPLPENPSAAKEFHRFTFTFSPEGA